MTGQSLYNYDFYNIRIPAFSFNKLKELNLVLEAVSLQNEISSENFKKLKGIFSDQLFVEGLLWASPALFEQLNKWLKSEIGSLEDQFKLLGALHRYYSRMSTRCTPFGTFAGTATGTFADKTEFQFNKKSFVKHKNLDFGFLTEIVRIIHKNPENLRQLKFRANDTIYKVNDRYIFAESSGLGDNTEDKLSSVTESIYIKLIISAAKDYIEFDELIKIIKSYDCNLEIARIQRFIGDLIDSQILISELFPNVTGNNYSSRLLTTLRKFNKIPEIVPLLESIKEDLDNQDTDIGTIIQRNKELKERITDLKSKDLFQGILSFNTHKNTINNKVIDEIFRDAKVLWEFEVPYNSTDMKNFKSSFNLRYEGMEVPLLEVLDTEIGLGYGLAISGTSEHMPLLSDITIKMEQPEEKYNVNVYSKLVKNVLKKFYKTGNPVIKLTENDIQPLKELKKNRKESIVQNGSKFIFGSILAPSVESLDNGEYKFFAKQLFNYSAARLLGRFSNHDTFLQEQLSRVINDEIDINKNFIMAEILHNPGGHPTNIVVRPSFYKYEIPINCKPSVDQDHIIFLSDIQVSIKNNRVVLRSKKFDKEVLPQMTTAFNPQRGGPLLKFLCDIQHQHMPEHFAWDWLENKDEFYLPRVEYNNIIMARARWKIDYSAAKLYPSFRSFKDYMEVIRKTFEMPRYVSVLQGLDNELCLDLDNDFCLKHLLKQLKHGDAILYEFLQTENNCFIKNGKDSYCNEIIIPFGTNKPAYPFSITEKSYGRIDEKNIFSIGSEWLFVKLYSGNKILDQLLKEEIIAFCDDLIEQDLIDKWFFIRYEDPERHLRIRFHLTDAIIGLQKVLSAFNDVFDPYLKNGSFRKIMSDTYVREIERYTENFIERSEDLFYHDSVSVCKFLEKIDGDEGEEYRWMAAVYSVDKLLSDFDFNGMERQQLMEELSFNFCNEFTNSKEDESKLNYSLNKKYREKSQIIKNLLTDDITNHLKDIFISFSQRSQKNRDIIKEMNKDDVFPLIKSRLIRSYIHMNLNRIFISRARNHEMVVYHFLKKFYTTANKLSVSVEQNFY